MRILSQDEIKIPAGGLVVGEDHPIELLGAVQTFEEYLGAKLGGIPAILFPDHDASIFEENNALQRNGLFDPYDCVTCAHQSQIDILYQAIFKKKQPPRSRRFTAIRSGTVPHVGNSNYNVQQSIIHTGMVNETDCVSMTPTMTEAQFYTPIPRMPLKEAFLKDGLVYQPFLVPTVDGKSAVNIDLCTALLYSPVVVSVCGQYTFDNGMVTRSSPNDSHDVLLLRTPTPTENYFLVLDSENPNGLVKFHPYYKFHYPVMAFLSRKTPAPNLIQVVKKKIEITLHDLFTKFINI